MHRRIHRLQNVWEHVVITGFSKNSRQTSQRKAASSGSSEGSDVLSQSVESGISSPFMSSIQAGVLRTNGGVEAREIRLESCGWDVGDVKIGSDRGDALDWRDAVGLSRASASCSLVSIGSFVFNFGLLQKVKFNG